MVNNLLDIPVWELANQLFANSEFMLEIPLEVFIKKLDNGHKYKKYFDAFYQKYYNTCEDGLIKTSVVRYLNNSIFFITNKLRSQKNCHILFNENIILCQGGCRYDCSVGDTQPNAFLNNVFQLPATIIKVDNYDYFTDNQGSVIKIIERYPYIHYQDRDEKRGSYRDVVREKGGTPEDQGGHLVANSIGGPSEAINIIPMPEQFNTGKEWTSMETYINNLIRNNNLFEGTIQTKIKYKNNSSQLPKYIEKQIFNSNGERICNPFVFDNIY